ncbi:MAG: hypothetical protein C0514_03420 [Candidatus Puniceispirillum sp.]|nr:hypothetical protein [Candidatus Puniceispirillum sp.]
MSKTLSKSNLKPYAVPTPLCLRQLQANGVIYTPVQEETPLYWSFFEDPNTGQGVLIFDAQNTVYALGFGNAQDVLSDLAPHLCSPLMGEKSFQAPAKGAPLSLSFRGTSLEEDVWHGLLARRQKGALLTYSDLAQDIGRPKAVRAVASAVGRNPISYFIPCHLVIRKDGGLGGYRWGLPSKNALLKEANLS